VRIGVGVQVDHRPDTRLAWGLGAVTLVCVAGPVVWAVTVADRLPPEVARHWGTGGRVTGSWPLPSQLVVLGTITLLLVGVCGAVAVLSRQPRSVRALVAACGTWPAVVLAVTQVGALQAQLDLADPRLASAPAASLALGAALGLVVGAAVAALAREPEHAVVATDPPAPELPRLTAPVGVPGDRVPDHEVPDDEVPDDEVPDDEVPDDEGSAPSWQATAAPSRALLVVVGVVLLVSALPALAGSAWPLVFGAVVAVPLLVLTRFSVTVDGAGLRVRAAPLTLLDVPLDQIAGADVIDHLDPFWEFGGWGLRVDVHGRTGLVSRAGEALAVTRADGSEVVVTVTDAAVAAATLNSLVDRRLAATS
jgi:hypothetical protein